MKKNYKLLFLFGALFWMALSTANAQSIRYVKQGGTGDGSSWGNASGDVQAMINASSDNDQVWVAKGIYKPFRRPDNIETSASANDRFNSFLLKANVSVYGGFAGDEDEIADRNILANETILSGNIGDQSTNEDNTYHVVTIVGYMGTKTFFDGFIIEDGYTEAVSGTANAIRVNDQNVPSTRSPGIIMYYVDHMELRNLIVRNNTNASDGQSSGALYIFSGGGGNLRNVQFINNKAMGGSGGAMFTYGLSNINCNVNFYNVSFIGNEASSNAGAIYMSQYSNLKFYDCGFEGNKAGSEGGVFYLGSSTSNADFYNTNFIGNEATLRGGAVRAPNSGRLNITGGIIKDNQVLATNAGGAISATASGLIINIKGAVFENNKVPGSGGGAIYFGTGTYSIEDSKFTNNTASSVGGAIYLEPNTIAPTKIINCDFENNTAGTNGGAIYLTGANTSAQIISCRILNNIGGTSGGALAINTNGALTVTNSIIYGNESRTTSSSGGGGAVYLYTGTKVTVINSTIAYNRVSTTRKAGGIYLAGTSQASLYNTISFGNRGGSTVANNGEHENFVTSGSTLTLKNTLTEYYGTTDASLGNTVAPTFNFVSTAPGTSGFLEIDPNNAASVNVIDKADVNDVPAGITSILKGLDFDALGKSRVQNGKMDIGGVEYLGAKSDPTRYLIKEYTIEGTGTKLNDVLGIPANTLGGNITKWEILSGNEAGAFDIDPLIGEIKVVNPQPLNYELIRQFVLTIRLENDLSATLGGPDYQKLTVIIDLENVLEIPEQPIVENVVHGNVVTTYRPRLRGIAEPNSIITIYVDGKPYPDAANPYTVTAGEDGAWNFRFPEELIPGFREFSVTSKPRRDAAESTPSPSAIVNLKLYGGGTSGLKPTNVLTPNGDGKNDTWIIENLAVMYPKHDIMIYDKVGKIVFKWSSSAQGPYDSDNVNGRAWDGTYNGNVLPSGTYYYDIKIANDGKMGVDRIKGTITIIKGR